MREFSIADEFRCLAAQCDVQAETNASGAENRSFLRNLSACLACLRCADAINLSVLVAWVSDQLLDEELPQFLLDCAGAMRLGAVAAVNTMAVAA